MQNMASVFGLEKQKGKETSESAENSQKVWLQLRPGWGPTLWILNTSLIEYYLCAWNSGEHFDVFSDLTFCQCYDMIIIFRRRKGSLGR